MFKAATTTTTTTAAGLPVPPGNSSNTQHKSPSTKRSLKNLFTAKRSRRPTANSATAVVRAPDSLDLDFGCSGLHDDEYNEVDEEDVLLEIRAALPGAAIGQLQLQASAGDGSASTSSRSGFGLGGDAEPGTTTMMHWQQQQRYRSKTVETQSSSRRQALDDGDDKQSSHFTYSSAMSKTNVTATTTYSPPSARSSASFSTLESSFYSTLSPSASFSSSSSDISACTSAILTHSLSSSSCASSDRAQVCTSAEPILPAWHSEETAEQGHLRRKQEEQAAIEALEAYFAIQTQLKQRQHGTATPGTSDAGDIVVEARRASEPTNVHHQHSRTDSGATIAAPATQAMRRGSAPTLLGLRYKRSEGSLQTLTRVVEAVGSQESHSLNDAMLSDNRGDSSTGASAEIGQAHSTDEQITLLPPRPSLLAQGIEHTAAAVPIPASTDCTSSRLPSHLPLPSVSLNSSRRPHDFRRARSSTVGTPRPVAMYSTSPSPSPSSSSSLLSLAVPEENAARFLTPAAAGRTVPLAHDAIGLPAPVPITRDTAVEASPQTPQTHTQIQRGQRSSSYFSTYYGREYVGRAPASTAAIANFSGSGNGNSSIAESAISPLNSIPPFPTLPVTLQYSQRVLEKTFIDVQYSPVECPGAGLVAQQQQSRGGDHEIERGMNFLDLQHSVGPSACYNTPRNVQ